MAEQALEERIPERMTQQESASPAPEQSEEYEGSSFQALSKAAIALSDLFYKMTAMTIALSVLINAWMKTDQWELAVLMIGVGLSIFAYGLFGVVDLSATHFPKLTINSKLSMGLMLIVVVFLSFYCVMLLWGIPEIVAALNNAAHPDTVAAAGHTGI